MPIYPPGKRSKKGKAIPKRETYANLSLTPMVDMFTILVVFLLQNYKSTGEVIQIPKDIKLPIASQTKELKPAHVVTIATNDVSFDKDKVALTADVKAQKDWMIKSLRDKVVETINKEQKALSDAKKAALPGQTVAAEAKADSIRKVTVQADKDQDFLTIKKIMYTVTEAGMGEINFAVTKEEK